MAFGVLLAIGLVVSILETVGIAGIFFVFQIILDPQRAAALPFGGWLPTSVSPERLTVIACIVLLIAFLAKALVSSFAYWLKWHVQWRLHIHLSTSLLRSYLDRSLSFHLRSNSSALLRNITANVSAVTQSCFLPAVDFVCDAVLLICITAGIFTLQPLGTLAVVTLAVVPAALFLYVGRKFFVRAGIRANEIAAEMYRTATEPLVGIKIVQTLGRQRFFNEQFRKRVVEYGDVARDHYFILQLPRQVIEFLLVAALLLTLGGAALRGGSPAELIPVLALFSAAVYRMMPSVLRMAAAVQNFRFANAALETISTEILSPQSQKLPRESPIKFEREIRLIDVDFAYEGAQTSALKGINMVVRHGEAVALVGRSGAGKTSLADILLGLHVPTAGSVQVDGTTYPDLAAVAREGVGYVPQETFLTDDTIRRNVAFGVIDGEIDENRIAAAVNAAALDELIAGLPAGLDTMVGERGVRLSGGQRQRLGIARALYHDPQLLVLDEATSSVDVTTEAEIALAIERLHGAKTLIVIAHRLSTVQRCDRIYYLENGRVDDVGTFEELSQRNASFKTMLNQMLIADRHGAG